LFNIFAILAIFISCLGLYGLSAFLAEQRTREIGVRKVLGAPVFNIVYLLSSSFTKLILIAVVIAIPLAWFAINSWLEGFAYRINLNWTIFFFASLAALFIAWLTISYESIKAAIANPVKSLRSE
jgi:putative ABC transport system permease protein